MVEYQTLLKDPLPTMNNIFSMVVQHERQDNFDQPGDSQVLINVIGFKKPNSKLGNFNFQLNTSKFKLCAHCGRTCHVTEGCYRKHEFSPHFGEGSTKNNSIANDNDDDTYSIKKNIEKNISSLITLEQFYKLVNLHQNSTVSQGISSATSN